MKPNIKAAGVLPYSKDAHGNTWFLLGREKPNESWGIDSGSWSEFGGSITSSETPEEGAAREFFEETMGCMWHKTWMENELKKGRYLLAMDSKTPSGKGYRSFVKYVPFVDYPGKFARYKTLAKKQPEIFRKMVPDCFHSGSHRAGGPGTRGGVMLQTCVEKTSMGWFSAEQMRKAVEKYKHVRQNLTHDHPPLTGAAATYCETDMIPHIRRGFAMDFDHLFTTEWARNNFQDDQMHFPLVKTPGHRFEIIESSSGTLRPRVETPQFVQNKNNINNSQKYQQKRRPKTPFCPTPARGLASNSASGALSSGLKGVKPPIIEVSTAGYSFKKKRKRKRHPRPVKSEKAVTTMMEKECSHSKSETKQRTSATSEVTGPKDKGMDKKNLSSQWTLVTNKKKKHKSDCSYKPTPPVF